jgi:hypothetical protein
MITVMLYLHFIILSNERPFLFSTCYLRTSSICMHRKYCDMFTVADFQLNVSSKSVFRGYVCRASNYLGKMDHVITLIQVSKPAVPKVSVHGARHDSVQIDIEGPHNEELDIIGYRVQYLTKQELKKGWDSAQVQEFNKGKSVNLMWF